jgi:anti-sigma regulatory factor (Ser/Thr protein kinase)
MDNSVFLSYVVEDRSYLSFIKREIHNTVTQAGFSSQRAGEVDIIVSELTSNLIKHATSGELIYRLKEEGNNKAFELFCIDNGPGTNEILRMMKDGTSTSNTLGHGLGAIGRLSDFFQIYSRENWGTVAYSKTYMNTLPHYLPKKTELHIKPIQLCIKGERVCGDGYYIKNTGEETQIFLGDGLGHGPHAHEAVETAIEAFKDHDSSQPIDILRHIHQKVKKTRGLVATIAILNHDSQHWKIGGIGNITTRLYQGVFSKNYMSYNGILGLNIPNTMSDYVVEEKHQGIIMCTDGIRTRWDLAKYPSILKYDASIIASAIFKDQARRTDDMTVLVGKINL